MDSTSEQGALSVRRIVITGILAAIAILLGVTRLGFIPVPNLTGNATIMHVPAIIGGVMEGPLVGGLVGLIFGIFSFLQATSPLFKDPLVSILPASLYRPSRLFYLCGAQEPQRVCGSRRIRRHRHIDQYCARAGHGDSAGLSDLARCHTDHPAGHRRNGHRRSDHSCRRRRLEADRQRPRRFVRLDAVLDLSPQPGLATGRSSHHVVRRRSACTPVPPIVRCCWPC